MEVMTTIAIAVVGLVLLYRYLTMVYTRSGVPGPPKYPLIGSLLRVKGNRLHELFMEFACQYGKMFEIQLFNSTVLVLNSAELVNKAFNSDGYKQVFNNRPESFIAQRISHLRAISLSQPDKRHADLRKSLSRGLHIYGDGIAAFESIVKEEVHRVMNQIDAFDGKEFEVVGLTKRSLCNVMNILMIGEQATDKDVEIYEDFNKNGDYFTNPFINTLLLKLPFLCHSPLFKARYDKMLLARQKMAERIFYKVKDTRTPGKIRGLVDWFLEEQQADIKEGRQPLFTDEVIVNNALDVLSAGVLTTSGVLPGALLCLINHPGYQTKIQEELDRVMGPDREPSLADKHDCHFLEAVVMETLRYQTPAPFLVPHVCSENTEFEGYVVKARTQILANIWYIHHDEKVWGDPWVFRPERFLDEDLKLLPNTHILMKSWMPFGTGRRKCPGMSLGRTRIFLYLSYLFRKWNFIQSPGKTGSCDPRSENFDCGLLFKPKPFYCIAKRRMFN